MAIADCREIYDAICGRREDVSEGMQDLSVRPLGADDVFTYRTRGVCRSGSRQRAHALISSASHTRLLP